MEKAFTSFLSEEDGAVGFLTAGLEDFGQAVEELNLQRSSAKWGEWPLLHQCLDGLSPFLRGPNCRQSRGSQRCDIIR